MHLVALMLEGKQEKEGFFLQSNSFIDGISVNIFHCEEKGEVDIKKHNRYLNRGYRKCRTPNIHFGVNFWIWVTPVVWYEIL